MCKRPFKLRLPTLSCFSFAYAPLDEMPERNPTFYPIPFDHKIVKHNTSSQISRSPSIRVSGLPMGELSSRTFIHLLISCVGENDIFTGKLTHCRIIKSGFSSYPFIVTSLVGLYSKCGLVEEARKVFDNISSRDLVLWNVMVSCYSLNGLGKEAFRVFDLMRGYGLIGDGFTFSSLLSSCSSLGCSSLGKQIHGLVIRLALNLDLVVSSALIDMYVKCRELEDARKAFDVMNTRNVVCWNTIIVGYGQHGEGKEAMQLLTQMVREGLKPDELTLASVLGSCANWAPVNKATQLHSYVVKNGFQSFVSICNALIVAYAKSGCIHNAHQCFRSIAKPTLISWSSMVSSYAFHGLAKEAIEIFDKMVLKDVKPDGIAFLGVLSACSHAGLVERGSHYFTSMKKDYQIEPGCEHYTCLVDLLARAGQLCEAYNVITSMPFEPGENIIGAFLGACKVYGNTGLAKWAAERLFIMEPDESVNYKLMSNIYASFGSWDDVAMVRKMMKKKCGSKVPGCSWVEIGGTVHTFVSNDESHRQASEMCLMLGVHSRLKKDESF